MRQPKGKKTKLFSTVSEIFQLDSWWKFAVVEKLFELPCHVKRGDMIIEVLIKAVGWDEVKPTFNANKVKIK